jgi:hypothetical protein
MPLESSYRQGRLAPRCRLITSWLRRVFQGFVCSPIKVVRELGLDRRETGWPLSASFYRSPIERSYERSPAQASKGKLLGHQAITLPRFAESRYDVWRGWDILTVEQDY